MRPILCAFCALWFLCSLSHSADEVTIQILPMEKLYIGQQGNASIVVHIQQGWHMYASDESTYIPFKIGASSDKKFADAHAHFNFFAPAYPPGISRKSSGSLYEQTFTIRWPVQPKLEMDPGQYTLGLHVSYQVCSDKMCLEPQNSVFEIPVTVEKFAGTTTPVEAPTSQVPVSEAPVTNQEPEGSKRGFLAQGLLLAFITAFFGGILTSLTPCVYPMIPITIAFFAGQSRNRKKTSILGLALVFVLGIATLYTALGVATGLLKKSFNVLLQNPWVIGSLALIFFLLGLSLFGVFVFRLPSFITSHTQVRRGGILGAYGRGLFLGIIAAPCMGPVSVAILPLVPANPWLGGLLLFVFACGVGVLFVILALFSGSLPKAGSWLHTVEQVLACFIIGVALLFLEVLVSLKVLAIIMGCLWTILGIHLTRKMLVEQRRSTGRIFAITLVFLLALVFLPGFAIRVGKLHLPEYLLNKALFYGDWEKDFERGMKIARIQNKPVLVDVWAKWCVPCREMDATTFRNAEVVAELRRFIKIKLDISLENDTNKAIMDKYEVYGAPSFLFFDSQGKFLDSKTIEGKVDTSKMLTTLQSIR